MINYFYLLFISSLIIVLFIYTVDVGSSSNSSYFQSNIVRPVDSTYKRVSPERSGQNVHSDNTKQGQTGSNININIEENGKDRRKNINDNGGSGVDNNGNVNDNIKINDPPGDHLGQIQRIVNTTKYTQVVFPFDYHSIGNEDKFVLDKFFYKNQIPILNGFFVELGALDGITYTNTYVLEKSLGWNGLLIEATPAMCPKLYNSNRTRTYIECTAVCNADSIDFVVGDDTALNGPKNMMWAGLQKYEVIKVTCQTLSGILTKYNVQKIDLFILDVEGGELSVLETFDWKVPVFLWLVELGDNYLHRGKNDQVRKVLHDHGYQDCPDRSGLHRVNACFYKPELAPSY